MVSTQHVELTPLEARIIDLSLKRYGRDTIAYILDGDFPGVKHTVAGVKRKQEEIDRLMLRMFDARNE